MKGQTDLIGLMIEASAGKHTIDQTAELTTDILKEDEGQNETETKRAMKPQDENKMVKLGKYLLSGIPMVEIYVKWLIRSVMISIDLN